MPEDAEKVQWQATTVSSPHLPVPISVVAAKNIAYFPHANRLQNLSIYLPNTPDTSSLIGTAATSLPTHNSKSTAPQWLVHIHGGAWRDPNLNSNSIEATVAHAFSSDDSVLEGIISLNYSVSPTQHPLFHPYDPIKDNHSDPAREAIHPMHIRDIFHGFSLLRSFGLTDNSFILSGHSAGVCLGCQATLQPAAYYGFHDLSDPPRPTAFLGFNGLYDLEQLVHGLGPSHVGTKDDYDTFLSITFGADHTKWPAASPARFDVDDIAKRIEDGKTQKLAVLHQSSDDQLVPMNQVERMLIQLNQVRGMKVLRGNRCTGKHSAPWEEGYMILDGVLDVLKLLKEGGGK